MKALIPTTQPISRRSRLLIGAAAIAILTAATPLAAATRSATPSWNPKVSERLVKLPATYLKKSLDRDFARSELGQAIKDMETEIALKGQTLSDLKSAIEQAEDEVLVELRHQFLAEKRAYLDLMSNKQKLQQKQVKTRHRVLERLLKRLMRKSGGMNKARRELVSRQDAARARFDGSASKVDMALFADNASPNSKYSKEYGRNLEAIQALVNAINNHLMNVQTALDGENISKPEYVRRMIAGAEAQMALITQESKIVGYMAKIVALDAMVLAEDIADSDLADGDVIEPTDITSVVNIFIDN